MGDYIMRHSPEHQENTRHEHGRQDHAQRVFNGYGSALLIFSLSIIVFFMFIHIISGAESPRRLQA